MDNENQPLPQQPIIQPQPMPVQQPTVINSNNAMLISSKPVRNIYETCMLVFGILTIISLLFNIGMLLKIMAVMFLVVSIVAILRSLFAPKQAISPFQPAQTTENVKKPRSPLKTLGLVILILIAIPVLLQGAFIVFLIVALSLGGGNMGT